MKLKHLLDDFQVEELLDRSIGQGEFALYRLSKRGLGTPEASAAIARRWHLPQSRIAYAGLKDRHAAIVQWLTIEHGPRRHLKQTNLELTYVGQTDRPVCSGDIAANRFCITLRDLSAGEARQAAARLPGLASDGAPNYFDRQRFGSLGHSRQFIARAWIDKDYQRALWLALADPNPSDRPADRAAKCLLRQQWGQWQAVLPALRPGPQRSAVEHLTKQPDDFRGALARIPPARRRLWIEALESHLWNRFLAALLRQTCRPEQLADFPLAGETLPLYTQLDGSQRESLLECCLPLPSARNHLEEGPIRTVVDAVLARDGLSLRDLAIDYPRDSFFSKGTRAAAFLPRNLSHRCDADECYPGRQKLVLSFELPRGCYATMIIRQLEQAAAG